jgi:hypothetical protein
MKLLARLALTTLGLQAAMLSGAQAQDDEKRPPIEITAFRTLGKGCPEATVTKFIDQWDARHHTLGLKLSDYYVEVDENTSSASSSCEIQLRLKVARGVRTALSTIKYVGTGNLKAGQQATLSANYLYRGQRLVSTSKTPNRVTGPFVGPVVIEDQADLRQPSTCESEVTLVLQTSLILRNSNPRAVGDLTISETQVDIQGAAPSAIVLDFLTEPCTPAP